MPKRRQNEDLAVAARGNRAQGAAGVLGSSNRVSDFRFGLDLYPLADRMRQLVEQALKAKK
jgi:hypothetical protein